MTVDRRSDSDGMSRDEEQALLLWALHVDYEVLGYH